MNKNQDNREFELNVTRIAMYKWLLNSNIMFIKSRIQYIVLFIDLLEGIEDEIIHNLDYYNSKNLNTRIKSNISSNRDRFFELIDKEPIRKRSIDKLKRDYQFIMTVAETNNKMLFTKLLKFITNISDRLFDNSQYIDYVIAFQKDIKDSKINRVFLSYAFKDRLYLLGIYDFFFIHGVHLYIDAFHNREHTDGDKLKEILSKELNRSNQFLFLRTPNSEFSMRGSYQIRQWCAWEIGYYHNLKMKQCFYFTVYEREIDKNKPVNLLIQSFVRLTKIENGSLK